MIYCIRKLNWQRAPSQNKTFRNYANYNPAHFCQDLKGVRLNTYIPSRFVTNVDQLWHDFKSAFVSVADRHAPIIQRRVRGIDNCLWLNKEIKSVVRQRDYFHSRARKTNHSEDWASYRCHRNRVSSATRRQRRPIIGALLIRVGTITKLFGERCKKFYLEKERLHLQTLLSAEL